MIVDTDCVTDIANAHAVEIVACGTCVGSSGWVTAACAACVAAIVEEDENALCCWCESCSGLIRA